MKTLLLLPSLSLALPERSEVRGTDSVDPEDKPQCTMGRFINVFCCWEHSTHVPPGTSQSQAREQHYPACIEKGEVTKRPEHTARGTAVIYVHHNVHIILHSDWSIAVQGCFSTVKPPIVPESMIYKSHSRIKLSP